MERSAEKVTSQVIRPLEEEQHIEQIKRSSQYVHEQVLQQHLNGGPSLNVFIQSNDNLSLPTNFKVGHATAKGSCFFDSFKQGIEQQLKVKVTVEELRKCCKDFALNNAPQWFVICIDNSYDNNGVVCKETVDSYAGIILTDSRWGDCEVEGRILCTKYKVKLHVIEKYNNVDGKDVIAHQIINSEGSKSVDGINYNEENTIHMLNGGKGHFKPVLRIQEIDLIDHEQRSSDLSDNDDLITPDEELIYTIKSNDSEEEKLAKIKKLFGKETKPNINFQNKDNDTPLHIAVRKQELKVIELLVKIGAKININNNKSRSPLWYAKRINRQDIMQILETSLDSKPHPPINMLLEREIGQFSNQTISVTKIQEQPQNRDKNTNIDTPNPVRKQGDPVHGNIYQLKLLMLFLYRGVSHDYYFRLGTEIEEAKKFDDLVFEYTKGDRKEYRLLQAKHRLDESKKITPDNLLTESDGDYSLTKYFFSYQDSKKEKLFKSGSIKDVTICTNIDFDHELLKSAQIRVEKIQDTDDILDVKSVKKQPMRYRFHEDVISLLKPNIHNFYLTKLARRLAECILENNSIKHHDNSDIFKSYHLALAEEVINIKTKTFHNKFVDGRDLSEDANKFRKTFIVEIQRKSEEKLILENINKHLSNKTKIIGDKPIGLNLSKHFGIGKDNKNWPNNVFSDGEIRDFLNHLVFAVNQPNEEELGKIIKREIGKGFNLDFITTRNTYNEFFVQMLEWMQGKARGRFLTYEEGKQLFEELRRGVSFDVKDPVHLFTGRELELCDLHSKIQRSSEKTTVISQITSISGLGGIGKTELARKYIQKHSKDYDDNIIWINAENKEFLFESFHRLAKDKLGICTKDADDNKKDIKSIVEDVYKVFSEKKCLFIFDNAEKNEYLKNFLPLRILTSETSKTNVLITSRNKEWEKGIEVIQLDVLVLEDAINLVKNGLDIKDESQDQEIHKLVEVLQCFPLAIQQAVAYIWDQTITDLFGISNYLVEYEKKTKELLNSKAFQGIDNNYARTTFTTWKITLAKIASDTKDGALALKIIDIIAYFAPENIYRELFLNLACNPNEIQLKSTVRLLVKFSMVNSEQKQSVLSIHRLVQEVIRIYVIDENREEDVLEEALGLLKNDIDRNTSSGPEDILCPSSVNHAVSVWGYASKCKKIVRGFGDIPALIVSKLEDTLRYQEASSFGNNALKLFESIFSHDHDYVIDLTKNVLSVLVIQGKDIEALKIYKKLVKNQHIIGQPNAGKSELIFWGCTFGLLLNQGKFDKAIELFFSFYSLIRVKSRSLDMPQGKLDDVFEMFQKFLKLYEEIPDNISILNTKDSIATLVPHQAKYENALKISREAYKKCKEELGPKHPHTLAAYWNIANCLYYLKKYDEAFKIANEVDKESEKLIPDNPRVIIAKELTVDILYAQGLLEDSLKLCKTVYEKKVTVLGKKPEDTLNNLYKIVSILTELHKYDEAIKQFIEFVKKVFGPDERQTLQAKNVISIVLNDMLLDAVQDSDSEKVNILLQKGAVAYLTDTNGNSLLHFAAQNGHFRIAELLLNHGADSNVKTEQDITPLWIAAQGGHIIVVEKLLEKGANINVKRNDGRTPLHIAVQNGHIGVVDKLLEKEASINIRDINGYTPLHIAVQNDHIGVVKLLLNNKGVDINATNKNMVTPLHLAANGHIEIVEKLLEKRANIDAKNINGYTSLHIASHSGHLNIVSALLNKGANVNCCDNALYTPLHIAAQEGQTEIVKTLLKHIADIEATKQLVNAIRQNRNQSVIQRLVEDGAMISFSSDTTRLTALHYAVSKGNLNVIKLLLGKTPNVNVVDEDGWTPLHYAAQDGYIEIVLLLLDKGADPKIKNKDRQTPVDMAEEKFAYDPQVYQKILDILKPRPENDFPILNV